MQNFNNNSFHAPSFHGQSQTSSDVFNINSLPLPQYGSSPNLAPQVQHFNYPIPQNTVTKIYYIEFKYFVYQIISIQFNYKFKKRWELSI